jgi:multicomponent Na+:H+ antiporter subunit G
MIAEIVVTALLLIGSVFLLLAAIGITRMPDLFSRIQATAKASTLGVTCLVLALAVYFSTPTITVRALLVMAFLLLTTPVAAHVLGRAAYFTNVALWEKTLIDELGNRINGQTPERKPDREDPPDLPETE